MEKKEFKEAFSRLAKDNGFKYTPGGWFRGNDELLMALDLQRSNFSERYYLNINIYVQGFWGKTLVIGKDLFKGLNRAVFRRHPPVYDEAFNLESPLDDFNRLGQLNKLFQTFLIPFSEKVLTKEGIAQLVKDGSLFMTDAVKAEFIRLGFAI